MAIDTPQLDSDMPRQTGSVELEESSEKSKQDENSGPCLRKHPHINYKQLADLYVHKQFQDEEKTGETVLISAEMIYEVYSELPIAGNQYINLKDARNSSDWSEWDKAMQAELGQLADMETWKLVDKSPDVVPIANK